MSDFDNLLRSMSEHGISYQSLSAQDKDVYNRLLSEHRRELERDKQKKLMAVGLPRRFIDEKKTQRAGKFIDRILKEQEHWETDGAFLYFKKDFITHYSSFVFFVRALADMKNVYFVESEDIFNRRRDLLQQVPLLALVIPDELEVKYLKFYTALLWGRWNDRKCTIVLSPLENTFEKGGSSIQDVMKILDMEKLNGF